MLVKYILFKSYSGLRKLHRKFGKIELSRITFLIQTLWIRYLKHRRHNLLLLFATEFESKALIMN